MHVDDITILTILLEILLRNCLDCLYGLFYLVLLLVSIITLHKELECLGIVGVVIKDQFLYFRDIFLVLLLIAVIEIDRYKVLAPYQL